MLKTSNEITPLEVVLQSAYEAIVDRVVSSPTDASGILLFGLEEKTESGIEGCKILLDLGVPSVDELKQIKELIKGILSRIFFFFFVLTFILDVSSLNVNTTHTNSSSIANVLFLANQQFSQRYMHCFLFFTFNFLLTFLQSYKVLFSSDYVHN